jgi:flagellar biosynthesis/type III secretory pathway protein FliH
MSSRLFLYENFDRGRHRPIGSSADDPVCASLEGDVRLHGEFEIARRESFAAGRALGFADGRQAALEEAETRLARDLPDLLSDLGGAAAEIENVRRTCEHDALRLAAAALRQMLPIVAERGLGAEAAALVAEVVANVPPRTVEVRASVRTREVIEQRCNRVPSGVTLITDPGMPDGSVRCAWAGGEARFDGAALQEAILAVLDRHLDQLKQAHAAWSPSEQDRTLQEE